MSFPLFHHRRHHPPRLPRRFLSSSDQPHQPDLLNTRSQPRHHHRPPFLPSRCIPDDSQLLHHSDASSLPHHRSSRSTNAICFEPGVQRGPHRKCNLTLAEQRTQMTLWSMAKSPLMFGGDLRNIDQITYNLITNPTLLEINAYSTNNMEYPHAFASGKRKHNVFPQRYRSLDHVHTPERKEVRLTSCSNKKSKGWVTTSEGVMDHICWKYGINISDNISHCLYMKRPLMTLDTHTREDRKDFQLLGADTMDMCLGASVNRKLSASERRSILLSACTWNGNQMWEINDDGTLVNRYSGLCAVVRPMEENVNTNGVRSWTATGRRGEIYLSFFNLNPDKKMISTRIKDLATTIDSRKLGSGSCKCHEVWTGKNFGIVTETLSMLVDAHGCRLFLLDCTK